MQYQVKVCVLLAVLLLLPWSLRGQPDTFPRWSVGISVISPGLPVAAKAVAGFDTWELGLEANYFYLWGMSRADARFRLKGTPQANVFGFLGMTGFFFAEDPSVPRDEERTLAADLGIGGEVRLGRDSPLRIGAEFGLLIPVLSNLSLDQYDNSGLLVANVYLLFDIGRRRLSSP